MDDDDFATVVKRWTAAAPAILVIEDLNWLFPNRVNVATFLNLVDGLVTPRGGGLMLVASTNHPDKLDPALSDRPGRFDVTMELPSPDAALRREFFRRALKPDAAGLPDEAVVVKLARETAGLSFAHLREVVQAAGLAVIRAGRDHRGADDLLQAAEAVARAHRSAGHGFPVRTEEPFGLAQFRAGSRDEEEGK
jgi:ATP-dependent 26S proteasome regulatory subunit